MAYPLIILPAGIIIIIEFMKIIGATLRIILAKRQGSIYTQKLKQFIVFDLILSIFHYLCLTHEFLNVFILINLLIIPPITTIWYLRHILRWKRKHKRIKEYDEDVRFKSYPQTVKTLNSQSIELDNSFLML